MRNALEALAVISAVDTCKIAGYCIIGSVVVWDELNAIREVEKREAVKSYYVNAIDRRAPLNKTDIIRAQALQARGLGSKDSMHLAVAESAGADVLLTVDDDFEGISTRKSLSVVRVINPLNFIQEVIRGYNEHS